MFSMNQLINCEARPDPQHALRGCFALGNLSYGGRIHQHRDEAACGRWSACMAFHDTDVVGVKAKRVQCDEIWSFTYAKQKNVAKAKTALEVLVTLGRGRQLTAIASS